jgi:hypothetical protein
MGEPKKKEVVCEQCEVEESSSAKRKKTREQCPKCKLWICDDCFNKDHIFCAGPDDPFLGPLRGKAYTR